MSKLEHGKKNVFHAIPLSSLEQKITHWSFSMVVICSTLFHNFFCSHMNNKKRRWLHNLWQTIMTLKTLIHNHVFFAPNMAITMANVTKFTCSKWLKEVLFVPPPPPCNSMDLINLTKLITSNEIKCQLHVAWVMCMQCQCLLMCE